ncbi:MAG: sulfur carrier protein ThiS adenylyltransferase ThiF [Candidatus Omnitrophica bacterium]|nr:sulfur carrier protein ThiS adenylyltransferase ThiF [Candidatus Omnitrophota bacterium]
MESLIENLIKKFGQDYFRKIQNTRVGLAGAGGLGSNCALNLVRVGFKRLTIIDFDVISLANLDRQFYFVNQAGMAKVTALRDNLRKINPDLEIEALQERIEPANIRDLFKDCDIIAECFDKAEYKSMLVQELLGAGKLIVGVSGLGGVGSSDEIMVHKIKKNLILIGDLKSDVSKKPPLAPRVSIAAAKQADVILEYVLNNGIIK